MNPYYQPYWLSDDELEHYGVKGMKWGVRKEDDAKSKTSSTFLSAIRFKSKKPIKSSIESKGTSREIITAPYENDVMKGAWTAYELTAKDYFDDMQSWGKADASKWDEAYEKAGQGYSDLEKAMMVAYKALEQRGLTYRFSVCIQGDTDNPDKPASVAFYDTKTGDVFNTLGECMKLARIDGK